jgi:adenylate kinase
MNLIIIGPQGSGKGTQAAKLADKFSLFYFSTGQILRRVVEKGGSLGKLVDKQVNQKGALVSDKTIIQVIDQEISPAKLKKGIVFDGFPRNQNQLRILTDFLEKNNSAIDRVFLTNISEKESIRRLSARLVCDDCGRNYNLLTKKPRKKGFCDACGGKLIKMDDDYPGAVKKRLKTYHRQTVPILKIYEKKGILEKIDGERPIELIFKDIVGRLKKAGLVK